MPVPPSSISTSRGTLGYSGEVFTMAIVLVRDLPALETCIAKHRVTQTESKASQMRTAQKLALARTILEENQISVFLADLDPRAALVSERKLDKDLLYDSMAGQALAYYLQRGDLQQGLSYRLSMDIRGSLRESYEDLVRDSIGNVLMNRESPLVSDIDVRFLDSKFSAGVQAADLFSNGLPHGALAEGLALPGLSAQVHRGGRGARRLRLRPAAAGRPDDADRQQPARAGGDGARGAQARVAVRG